MATSGADSDQQFGQCRCCLNFGYHNDLTEPYYCSGIREILQDKFLGCFNLVLSKNTELTNLICKACIRQLQDASEFKDMVMESERQLLSDLGISNVEFANVFETDNGDVGEKATNDKNNVNVTIKHKGNKTVENYDETIKNHDEIIQNDNETTQNDDANIEKYDETIENDVETIENDVETIKNNVATIENDVENIENDDETIENDGENIVNDDETIENDDETIENYDETIENDFETIENDFETIENYVETIENDDKIIENDIWTIQNEDELIEKYYDSTGMNCIQEENDNFVLLIVGDEKIGKEGSVTCKMNNYAGSLRPRKAIKKTQEPTKLASEDLTDEKLDPDWLDSDSDNTTINKKSYRKSKKEEIREGDLKVYTNEDIPLESLLKYSCSLCKYRTNIPVHLQRHIKAHSAKNTYACDICGYIATTKKLFNIHAHIHTGVKPFACKICEKRFLRLTLLKMHIRRSHAVDKPYSCKYCDKAFKDNSGLYAHTKRHTDRKSKKLTCKICDKKLANNSSYKDHVRTHYNRKLVACDICNKKMVPTSLHAHKRLHSNVKVHSCHLCDFKTAIKYTLLRHIDTHVKPHVCDICDKKFARKQRLKDHYFTEHTNEKPYSCKLCKDKRFPSQTTLYNHMNTRHKQDKWS